MKNLKVVFMGTPAFSVPVLENLIANYNVVLVVSQPNREKDRKGNYIDTPTVKAAKEHGINYYQPQNIRKEYDKVLEYLPDIIITCAYGQIIPETILNYPRYGCINVHGSLLPKLRGGAPIHHAIMNGDKETGITIMYMDKSMDSGDIISQSTLPIEENATLDDIYIKMSNLGAELLIETLPSILTKTNKRIKQNENEVTFGYNITKEEEKINFHNNCETIHNHIRGLSSIPGAYCYLNNKRLKIYKSIKTNIKSSNSPGTIQKIDKTGIYVNTNDYLIALVDLKLEGKKRCYINDFVNGINPKDYIGKALQ